MTNTTASKKKSTRILSAAVTSIALIGSGLGMASTASAASSDVINPLVPETYRYSSEYGPRCIPVINGSTIHEGQDLAQADGSTIRAIADGIVTFVRNPVGGGSGYLAIKHVIDGEVVYSGYYHMWQASKYVKVGQKVKKGERIALVGNSGPSTAPHLHFEIWKKAFYGNGYTVNPVNYMKSQGVDLKADSYLAYNLSKPSSCTYFAASKVNLRSEASNFAPIVQTAYQNQALSSIPGRSSQSGSFIKVSVNGETGWAPRSYVSPYKVRQTEASSGSQLPSADDIKTENTTSGVKYKTTANLNMRSGAGTSNSVVRVLTQGTDVVTTGKKAGTWLQVKTNNVVGWVSDSYLVKQAGVQNPTPPVSNKPNPPATTPPSTNIKAESYSVTGDVNFRAGASTGTKSLAILPTGLKLSGTGKKSGTWIQVKNGSVTGWVSSAYLKVASVPAAKPPVANASTYVTTGNVNFRAGAGTSHKSLSVLKTGTKVTGTGKKSGTWTQVKSGNTTGWVSSTYLKAGTSNVKLPAKPSATSKTKTVKSNLNMRSSASMSGKVVTVLRANTKVSVLSTNGAWTQVKIGTKVGWVVGSYLK